MSAENRRAVSVNALAMPDLALLCRSVVHLSAQRALATRVVLTRRFYQWRCDAVQGREEGTGEGEDEQVRTTRASVLSAFANTDRLSAELAQINAELEAHNRVLRKNGSRVVLRQFLKQRLYASIQRAFTVWMVVTQVGKGVSVPLSLLKRGFRAVKAEESHAKDSQMQNTRLRFALLVYVFHLKWRSNAKIAALEAARDEDEHSRRVLWGEVCALKRGLAKVDEYEAAVLVTAHKRGGDTMELIDKLRQDLGAMPSSAHLHKQHHHHHHHQRHHHHRNRGQRSRSTSPERSRSPSPERRALPTADAPAPPTPGNTATPASAPTSSSIPPSPPADALTKGFTVAALPPPRRRDDAPHQGGEPRRGSFLGSVPPPSGEASSSRGPRRDTVSTGGTRVSVNLSSSSGKRASLV